MRKFCAHLMAVLFVSCGFTFGQESITFYPSEGSNGVGINGLVSPSVQRVEDRNGVANKAFKLSGSDGIRTAENLELNGSSMSFSLWLKVDENQTAGYPHVFRFGDEDGWPSIALDLNRNTNILGAIHDVSSGVQKRVNASPLQFGSWYHAAIVTENNEFRFYLNGSLVGSSSLSLPVTGPTFWTGGNVPFAAGGFTGTLDEIRIFDYALDADSIEVLANGQVTEPVSEQGLLLSRIPGEGYARLEQEILIENGKQYRTIIEIDGEYENQPSDKLPHLCPGCFEFNFDSYTVEFDGSITTIEGVFVSDKEGLYDLSLALFSVPQLKFRKVELIDLTTQQNLISNSNFAAGLQGWNANGGTIELYDLNPPVIYTLAEAASPNGSVTGYGEFESGSEITLAATPNLGYRFTGWTGSVTGSQNPLSVIINQDLTVGASFIQDTRDADDDGLTNYAELVVYGSDPNDNDTDDDGIPDGAEVDAGLNILQPESISEAVALLTAARDGVAAQRDEAIAQRDARPTFEQLTDARLGSVVLVADAETNKVRLRFCIEESDQLGQWITRDEEAEVEIPLVPEKKFFRFSVKEDE